MDKKLNNLKEQLLREELKGFEFTTDMKNNIYRKMEGKPKMRRKFKIVPIVLTFVLFSVCITGLFMFMNSEFQNKTAEPVPHTGHKSNDPKDPDKGEVMKQPDGKIENVENTLSEEEAVQLLEQYESLTRNFFSEDNIDEDTGKITGYATIEEVYSIFTDIMGEAIIEKTYKGRILEREDGLYTFGMGWPAFLLETDPYQFEKSNDEYKIIQQQTRELYEGLFTATFYLENGTWKIKDIEFDG